MSTKRASLRSVLYVLYTEYNERGKKGWCYIINADGFEEFNSIPLFYNYDLTIRDLSLFSRPRRIYIANNTFVRWNYAIVL